MSDQGTARKTTVEAAGDREIKAERIFDAPREKVFNAFVDPELIPQWWGPHDSEVTVDVMEVRNGGSWRFVHSGPQGETGFRGTFREITPPERVVQTFEWEGMPGHIAVDTAEFDDLGDQTRVRITSLFHTEEERDGMLGSGMERGLSESHERLDALLAAS